MRCPNAVSRPGLRPVRQAENKFQNPILPNRMQRLQREERAVERLRRLVGEQTTQQHRTLGEFPRRRGRRVEPLRDLSGLDRPRLQLAQQLRLAAAGGPPEVDRRAGPALLAQLQGLFAGVADLSRLPG